MRTIRRRQCAHKVIYKGVEKNVLLSVEPLSFLGRNRREFLYYFLYYLTLNLFYVSREMVQTQ